MSQANKTITLYAKGYAREGVDESEILKILQVAKGKLPLFNLHLKKDARGIYIEMRHVSDYSAGGIPIRLFLVLLLSFSWCFEEVMALDKDQQFDLCRTRQGYPVSLKLEKLSCELMLVPCHIDNAFHTGFVMARFKASHGILARLFECPN